LTRSLKLAYPSDFPFYHPDLGRSHFVYSFFGGAAFAAARVLAVATRDFKTYVEQKHQTCKTYAVAFGAASNAVEMRNDVGRR
jgi:hypothetical protein